jgi:N-acetylglucosaminyldiphosphoundecaprenol N-acetyl-beta-D-mannosaminyltransferase
MTRINIGAIPVDILSTEEILGKIFARICEKLPSQLITLNSLMYNMLLHNKELERAMLSAFLVLPDSIGISTAAGMFGKMRVDRLPGIDLMDNICETASKNGFRIYLLGSKPGIAELTAEKLKTRHRSLEIAGTMHGYFESVEENAVIEKIRLSRADILFVGFAIPHQEIWIQKNLLSLGVPIVMGIGGSFDVISGRLKRAPLWMRYMGIEWMFRVLQEPWRIFRIKDLPLFAWNMLKLLLRN